MGTTDVPRVTTYGVHSAGFLLCSEYPPAGTLSGLHSTYKGQWALQSTQQE